MHALRKCKAHVSLVLVEEAGKKQRHVAHTLAFLFQTLSKYLWQRHIGIVTIT
jgi:hypothetical protein